MSEANFLEFVLGHSTDGSSWIFFKK